MKTITVYIYDIKWDKDEDDDTELPTEIKHEFEYNEDDDKLLDNISDWLSDEYGYCHDGFNAHKEAKENEN